MHFSIRHGNLSTTGREIREEKTNEFYLIFIGARINYTTRKFKVVRLDSAIGNLIRWIIVLLNG